TRLHRHNVRRDATARNRLRNRAGRLRWAGQGAAGSRVVAALASNAYWCIAIGRIVVGGRMGIVALLRRIALVGREGLIGPIAWVGWRWRGCRCAAGSTTVPIGRHGGTVVGGITSHV